MHAHVDAEIVRLSPSLESGMYVLALLSFVSSSPSACRVVRYLLTWDGGSVSAEPSDFVLVPGEARERRLKIAPDKGDLEALLAGRGVRLEVEARWRR